MSSNPFQDHHGSFSLTLSPTTKPKFVQVSLCTNHVCVINNFKTTLSHKISNLMISAPPSIANYS